MRSESQWARRGPPTGSVSGSAVIYPAARVFVFLGNLWRDISSYESFVGPAIDPGEMRRRTGSV